MFDFILRIWSVGAILHRESTDSLTRGGVKVAPPSTFYGKWVRNSGTQQAIVITLEVSSKYIIQYILGENQGNPTLLIN